MAGEVTDEPSFRALVTAKARFVVPVTVGYLVVYLGLTLVAGYAPGVLREPVLGAISLGYVLIFAVYLGAWAIAVVYVRVANRRFDPLAAEAVRRHHRPGVPE